MIDWTQVGFGALWILGLSLLLAAAGLADYEAGRRKARLRAVLAEPAYQAALNGGLGLFCLGLLGSARAWWEQVLWGLLVAAFVAQAGQAWRRWRRRRD